MTDLSQRGTLAVPARRIMGRGAIAPKVLTDIYAGVDAAIIMLTGLAAAHVYVWGGLGIEDYLATYFWPILLASAALPLVNRRAGLYRLDRLVRFAPNAGPIVGRVLAVFLALALVGAAVGVANDYSRLWFGTWLAASLVAVLLFRALASRVYGSVPVRDAIRRKVVVYGFGAPLKALLRKFHAGEVDAELAGVFTHGGVGIDGAGKGDANDLVRFGQENEVDTVIIAVPAGATVRLDGLLNQLGLLPVDIRLYASFGGAELPVVATETMDGLPAVGLQRKPISDWGMQVKRVLDLVLASLALVGLAPLLLLTAIAIKLESSGPVLFRQERGGLNNRLFTIYKFRTMRAAGSDGFAQAQRNDARVTAVGRILRRLSIDELPQLLNVLKGEMSIVGPRPHPVPLNERFEVTLPLYARRNRVRPGITGWAQINDCRGPTETDEEMRKRLEHDLHYIDNWSVWLDLSIIVATPFMGLVHKNAV